MILFDESKLILQLVEMKAISIFFLSQEELKIEASGNTERNNGREKQG